MSPDIEISLGRIGIYNTPRLKDYIFRDPAAYTDRLIRSELSRGNLTEKELRSALDVWDTYFQGNNLEARLITAQHSMEVSVFVLIEAGVLDHNSRLKLSIAACLHDIGKTDGSLDDIFNYEMRYTKIQKEQMKTHPLLSETYLKNSGLPNIVADIAGQHHERWDGSGYPRQLSNHDIDLTSMLAGIADNTQVAFYPRSYDLNGQTHLQAIQDIRNKFGSKFTPLLQPAFERMARVIGQEKVASYIHEETMNFVYGRQKTNVFETAISIANKASEIG